MADLFPYLINSRSLKSILTRVYAWSIFFDNLTHMHAHTHAHKHTHTHTHARTHTHTHTHTDTEIVIICFEAGCKTSAI